MANCCVAEGSGLSGARKARRAVQRECGRALNGGKDDPKEYGSGSAPGSAKHGVKFAERGRSNASLLGAETVRVYQKGEM